MIKKLSLLLLLVVAIFPQYARATGPTTVFDMTRMLYFIMNGFPSSNDYQKYFGQAPNSAEQNAIMGTVQETLQVVQYLLQLTLHGDCNSLPTTGSIGSTSVNLPATSQTATITINFAAPKITLPAGYSNGGLKLDRRVAAILSTGETITTELSCSKPAVWVQDAVSSNGSTVSLNEFYLDRGNNGDGTDLSLDYYLWNLVAAPTNTDYVTVQLRGATGGIMNLWITEAGNIGTGPTSYFWRRSAASVNVSSQQVSVYTDAFLADSMADALAVPGGTSTTVSGGSTPSGLTVFPAQGCGSFLSPDTDATDSTLCAGLTLSAPPTPAIDSSGSTTASWVANTMASKMATAP